MQLVDANVLLYATNSAARQHRRCRAWLEAALAGPDAVGFSWQVLLAFLRLSTKSQIFARPLTTGQALDVVEAWLAQPASIVVHPTDRHAAALRSLLEPLGTGGNLTSDAHLAALALSHGATLVSCDADFARFPGLRWRNPLA